MLLIPIFDGELSTFVLAVDDYLVFIAVLDDIVICRCSANTALCLHQRAPCAGWLIIRNAAICSHCSFSLFVLVCL